MMNLTLSEKYFERARRVLPGGVNSPVRAFGSINMNPPFITKAEGAYIYDEDDNSYIDFVGSWGPMILGHNHELVRKAVISAAEKGLSFGACTKAEVELAELICSNIKWVEMIRMVSSGTEAVMSAIRAARGYTSKEKIIKFVGCYHGHSDSLLVQSGSGAMTFGSPDSKGVTRGAAKDTLTARFNDLDMVSELLEANNGEVAAIILEPVAANMGVIPPKEGFLQGLRRLCDKHGTLLIFDEVITGFRLSFGGAAQYYKVEPDLVCYGKIIGGGMPVGAYGGRKDIMSCVSPLGKVYQAGTLSGNPIAMAAGIATLTQLLDNPQIYQYINNLGEKFAKSLRAKGPCTVNQVGSILTIFHQEGDVASYDDAVRSNIDRFNENFIKLINSGIYMAPSQFEAIFLCNAHNDEHIKKFIDTIY